MESTNLKDQIEQATKESMVDLATVISSMTWEEGGSEARFGYNLACRNILALIERGWNVGPRSSNG